MWSGLAAAGLDSVPVNTFSYYDQMLDTAVMLGALPARAGAVSDDLDRYFAAARGNKDVAPLEMTKWFDTNYHYIVPEIEPATKFALNRARSLSELKEALGQGIPARPVVIGPVTFLLLSKAVNGGRTDRAAPGAGADLRPSCCRCSPTRRAVGAVGRARAGHRHLARRPRAGRGGLQRAGRSAEAARNLRRHLFR